MDLIYYYTIPTVIKYDVLTYINFIHFAKVGPKICEKKKTILIDLKIFVMKKGTCNIIDLIIKYTLFI